jgi:nitroimidazol reductase NimA-like FMN-containing flavoprotein (pyridoxamine 5'-phosphate oxidase superfamily)
VGTLHDLSQSECRALLADHQAGRAAVVAPDGPHIIPVNYALVDETIVFRTSPFTLLATHGRDAAIAFEVDHLHELSKTGWSVLARGRTEVVFDSQQIEHIRRIWEPTPWADGARNLYIRLKIAELSGRRVGDGAALPVGHG